MKVVHVLYLVNILLLVVPFVNVIVAVGSSLMLSALGCLPVVLCSSLTSVKAYLLFHLSPSHPNASTAQKSRTEIIELYKQNANRRKQIIEQWLNKETPEASNSALSHQFCQIYQLHSYCAICDTIMPPRSHHCSKCNRCVSHMQLHCSILQLCIGDGNIRDYVHWLVWLTCLYCYQVLVMTILVTEHSNKFKHLGMVHSLGFVVWCLFLFFGTVRICSRLFITLRALIYNLSVMEQLSTPLTSNHIIELVATNPFRDDYFKSLFPSWTNIFWGESSQITFSEWLHQQVELVNDE